MTYASNTNVVGTATAILEYAGRPVEEVQASADERLLVPMAVNLTIPLTLLPRVNSTENPIPTRLSGGESDSNSNLGHRF